MTPQYHTIYHQHGKQPLDLTKHTHPDCYELIQPLSDGGSILIRDCLYPLCSGSLYLINAMHVHSTNPQTPTDYMRNIIRINSTLADSLFSLLSLTDFITVLGKDGGAFYKLDTKTADRVDSCFRACTEALNRKEHSKAYFLQALGNMLLTILAKKEEASPYESSVSRIFRFINSHLCEPLTIDCIADGINLNKYHLCHIFREKTGMTVMSYLLEQRLVLAKEQLISTTAPILEIALSCGFENASYFSRAFLKKEGMTPRDYRKKYTTI